MRWKDVGNVETNALKVTSRKGIEDRAPKVAVPYLGLPSCKASYYSTEHKLHFAKSVSIYSLHEPPWSDRKLTFLDQPSPPFSKSHLAAHFLLLPTFFTSYLLPLSVECIE